MMRRAMLYGLTVAAITLVSGTPPAHAQQIKPVCSDNTRACLLKTVSIYIDGLSHHDASAIPFAKDVRCTEQGDVVVTDEAKFRSEINTSTAILGSRNLRLMADPETKSVAAFYLLDIAASAGAPAYTVRRGQRFKIVGGYVTEVEVFNYVDPKLPGLAKPLWPDR